MNGPLVSVIVTTYNNHATLDECLASIKGQTYKHIELIVVDNHSTDDTKEIARSYTPHVFNKGPERSAQRNYAARQASGDYVLIIDSDMVLSDRIVSACIQEIAKHPELGGLIIPEESFGKGFWAQCKRLERSFYIGIDAIEAARFFRSELFRKVDGYDTQMISGEDWDLSRRIGSLAPIGRINELIYHNEGKLSLVKTLRKKYYYAGKARAFLEKQNVGSKLTDQSGPLQRYKLFFSRPTKLFRNPLLGVGVLFMKTCEYAFGALGYYLQPTEKESAR